MSTWFIKLFCIGIISTFHFCSADRDTFPEDPHDRPFSSPHGHISTPFIDLLPEEISLINRRPSITNENPFGNHYDGHGIEQQDIAFSDQIDDLDPSTAVMFGIAVNTLKTELRGIKLRQDVLSKYAKCSYSESENCKELYQKEEDYLKGIDDWEKIHSEEQVVREDKLVEVMNILLEAIEKLTLRQNMLYEYVTCPRSATKGCSPQMKLVLDVMFNNNTEVSGKILQNLFSSTERSVTTNFFQFLSNIFNTMPNFADWFSGFNFHPFSYIFGTLQNKPIGNFFSSFTGIRPTYSAGGFYSSSINSQPPVSIVSSGSVKPTHGEYTVNSNGGTSHVSYSSNGSGGSSVSSFTSSGSKAADGDTQQIIQDNLRAASIQAVAYDTVKAANGAAAASQAETQHPMEKGASVVTGVSADTQKVTPD